MLTPISSKLPQVGTTIFTVISRLAQQHGAINLSQGFPNFDCSEKLKMRVAEEMVRGHNQYAPMPGVPELRFAVAEKIQYLYGVRPDPDGEITITAGATQAIFTAITAFIRPGDEVILLEPAYDSYQPVVELNGGIVVPYIMEGPDYRVDWEDLTQLVSERTRMIVINTPHNPTGQILQESDLQALDQLTRGTDILVLSDEVYEHLIFDKEAHQSVLRFPELRQRSLVAYSFGKTFHATGWKMGYCVAPEPLMAEFRKVHQFLVFSVNTPIQYALANYMQDRATYEGLPSFFQEKRDLFLEVMRGSSLRPLPSKGTYFQLFDYRAVKDLPDRAFTEWLIKEVGVAAIPVSAFYADGRDERVIRLCFAKTPETLIRAGSLLKNL